MGRIQVLQSHVVNQIAAGEVIERPASAVKELVENALDVGARRVEVRVEEGGRALIEVTDDGHWMDLEDLTRAFLPHATSKIRSAEDLRHVGSLGFRGAALASLGSVAVVALVSRAAGEDTGTIFLPRRRLSSRKRWIAFASGVSGTVVVTSGARRALQERGASLLFAGIRAIDGEFERGDVVAIMDSWGDEFARGMTNHDSASARRLIGKHTRAVAELTQQPRPAQRRLPVPGAAAARGRRDDGDAQRPG